VAVSATVEELAAAIRVDPGHVRVLLARYRDEVADLWAEEGPVSRAGAHEAHRVFDSNGEHTVPER
jgi:hypothetical protein